VDDGGGAAVAFLSDSQADFVTSGVRANAGMILYNLTTSLNGPVTAVTTTTITATGVTWTNGDFYRIVTIDAQEIATIELYLDIAASDIHAAMAGSGMCDCTLANWATAYLEKLNIIDAASYYQCPCGQPHMTDEMRQSYLRWCSDQLALIRTGQTELCHGATGSDFPAVGWAEQGLTEFATAEIIANYAARNG
jgi:hypothetical protein